MIALAILILIAAALIIRMLTDKARKPLLSKGASRCVCLALTVAILLALARVAVGPIGPSIRDDRINSAMQACRTLSLAMFQYANDHDGKYPDGNNSTEVFQKLVDGNYITDPAIFYVPMVGKIKGVNGQRLKPENVCYDVTSGVDANSPDGLPLVFNTGYKVDYRPGGNAVSLTAPYPSFGGSTRTWWEWFRGERSEPFRPYLAVCYHSNNAFSKRLDVPPSGYGCVRDFVPADFDAKGQTYHQLTPDGVLK